MTYEDYMEQHGEDHRIEQYNATHKGECDLCGSEVYLEDLYDLDGYSICSDCWSERVRTCAICGNSATDCTIVFTNEYDEVHVCESCLTETWLCPECGESYIEQPEECGCGYREDKGDEDD